MPHVHDGVLFTARFARFPFIGSRPQPHTELYHHESFRETFEGASTSRMKWSLRLLGELRHLLTGVQTCCFDSLISWFPSAVCVSIIVVCRALLSWPHHLRIVSRSLMLIFLLFYTSVITSGCSSAAPPSMSCWISHYLHELLEAVISGGV